MPNPIVQIRGLSKAYRRDSMQIPVLRDITLEVPEGEFLGLMGPSGSGKTTLLNLIAGIDRPDAGSVLVAGTDVTTLSESQLARKSAEEILTLLERLNREFKKTIVMVTHDPHAAERAHLVRHLDKGELQ